MRNKAFQFRSIRAVKLAAAATLAIAVAGCGPEEVEQASTDQYSLLNSGDPLQWPGSNFGLLNSGYPAGALPPLPDAQPMAASYPASNPPSQYSGSQYAPRYGGSDVGYGYAPSYYDDYYSDPQDYYEPSEPVYYDDNADDSSYAYLALAALLGGVLADSPPDSAFRYGNVQPWVWQTGDRYTRYAEPVSGGYRYYYFEPNAPRPFLVRDPYYSYGYRDDRLVAIYDRDGRVIDRKRMLRQRRLAERYYDRGFDLHRVGIRERHYGVAAPLWARQRTVIVREQSDWNRARDRRDAWQTWDRRHQPVTQARWSQEEVVRRYAGQRFDDWQRTQYRGPAPQFYREAVRNERVQRDIRVRQTAVIREQRDLQRRQLVNNDRNRAIAAREIRDRQTGRTDVRRPEMQRQIAVRNQAQAAQQAAVRRQQMQARAVSQQRETRQTQVAQQAAARRQKVQARAVNQQRETRQTQVAQQAAARRQQAQARAVSQQRETRQAQVAQQAAARRQQAQARAVSQQRETRQTQVAQQAAARRQQAQARAVRQQRETRQSQVAQQAAARRQQAQARAVSQQRETRQSQVAQQAAARRQQAQTRAMNSQREMRQSAVRQNQAVSQQRQVVQRNQQNQMQQLRNARPDSPGRRMANREDR